jgi:chromosome segregation ATPase
MPKPPLAERIKALEDANKQLIDKIDRMKAQVKHNNEVIRKLKKREDKQDVAALMDELQRKQQQEQDRRTEQSKRDRQRTKETKAAKYRKEMEYRLRQCRIMNGLEPDDD